MAALPAAALAAVRTVTIGEIPLVRLLFAVRSGPAMLARGQGLPRERERPLWELMVEYGFVELAADEDEVALGYVGQPWKLTGGRRVELGSRAEWEAFSAPGFVKAAMSFRAEAREGGVVLTTETRVTATDPVAGRRFARYWRLIRPGSGAIRRSWLRAAARRAEAG